MFSYPAVLNVNTSYVGPGYKSEHMCIFIIYQTYNHLKKKNLPIQVGIQFHLLLN